MYEEHLAKLAWVFLFIGFNMLYFPMFVLGWQGMPRRYYDYLPKFNAPNLVSTIGSWILAMGLFIMFYNLDPLALRGRKGRGQSLGRGDARVADVLAAADGELREDPRGHEGTVYVQVRASAKLRSKKISIIDYLVLFKI